MKMDGREAVKAIKERLNLADLVRRYVPLRQQGARAMGCCPFHQEKSPSFSVNADEGFFYCFGCQASGDIFDFYSRINGLEFKEALEQLAEECGISLERGNYRGSGGQSAQLGGGEKSLKQQALAMHELAKLHFVQNLKASDGEEARTYLKKRGLSPELVQRFELGWSNPGWNSLHDALRRGGFAAPEAAQCGLLSKSERGSFYDRFRGRLMFPIRNLAGKVVAFGGRILQKSDDQPKYINSSDSPIYKKGENLYGLFESRRAITQERSIILTEGYMDVISLHQFGIENSCGVLGTALTPEQVKRLGQLSSKIILLFDGDRAGRKAALRSAEMILVQGLSCSVVLLPEGEDIDSLLHNQGPEAFATLRQSALEGLRFCLSTLRRDFAPKEQLDWAGKFLIQIREPHLKSRYAGELAAQFGVDETLLRQSMLGPNNSGDRPGARPGDGLGGSRATQGANGTQAVSQQWVARKTPTSANSFSGWKNQGLGNGEFSRANAYNSRQSSKEGFAGQGFAGQRRDGWQSRYVAPAPPPPPPPSPAVNILEQQLMKFVVRYPQHVAKLRECGAEWFISTDFAKALWNKLLKYADEYSSSEVVAILTDKEKEFWIRCRVTEHLPEDKAKEDEELNEVCATLARSHRRAHGKTCLAALRQIEGNDGTDLDLLKALQETLRRSSDE